jgi:membrane protein YdbS with pleckstrin-like domain
MLRPTHTRGGERPLRDELEHLQGVLREARQQREELQREHAGLEAKLVPLEEELGALRQTLQAERALRSQPMPLLPVWLEPPFRVWTSRRAGYWRSRFLLWMLGPLGAWMGLLAASSFFDAWRIALWSLVTFLLLVWRLYLAGVPVRDPWCFEAEGFSSDPWRSRGVVPYRDMLEVEVKRGVLQRRFGLGTVQVWWKPATRTLLEWLTGRRRRVVEIGPMEEPERLAKWLLGRREDTDAPPRGETHAA